ncbi:MAG: hypothetical protein ABH986_05055 [archaeon]
MAVLVCDSCGGKVESNRCHGKPMEVKGKVLKCSECKKTVEINYCCGHTMQEHKEMAMHGHKH